MFMYVKLILFAEWVQIVIICLKIIISGPTPSKIVFILRHVFALG